MWHQLEYGFQIEIVRYKNCFRQLNYFWLVIEIVKLILEEFI